jgi:hypothetical protein
MTLTVDQRIERGLVLVLFRARLKYLHRVTALTRMGSFSAIDIVNLIAADTSK